MDEHLCWDTTIFAVWDPFEREAGTSEREKAVLAVLKSLKEKSFLVLSQHRSNSDGHTPPPNWMILNSQEYGTNELALFEGQMRVVISKNLRTANREGTMENPSAPSDSGIAVDMDKQRMAFGKESGILTQRLLASSLLNLRGFTLIEEVRTCYRAGGTIKSRILSVVNILATNTK
ncbi:hypothetical protein FIBSPDRAFT_884461 [Athelia psychrophila]|uniref:Uncharacterized protein n=1 Tax=Athelia psychrophila TaxID=1759441 RepID=A0A166T599_9AGAM|nr:hypothetical protein FIBSPDRAFT_884461 [Fibularhizoctonia sp. CBS 109695]